MRRAFLDLMRVATVTQVHGTFQAAIKEAMRALGLIEKATVRMPGTPLTNDARAQIRRNLEAIGMLHAEAPKTPAPPVDDLDAASAESGTKTGAAGTMDL
jgi:hypothetical protein